MGQEAQCPSSLQEEGKKIIDVDTAVQMLSVAMPTCKHLEPFTEFLQEQTEYRTINRDQWMGFLRFTQQVGSHAAMCAFVLWKGTLLKHAAGLCHHLAWGVELCL